MTEKKPVETDAGMAEAGEASLKRMDAAERPWNPADYKTEAEAMAALRARMGDEAFERMSSADGIVGVSK